MKGKLTYKIKNDNKKYISFFDFQGKTHDYIGDYLSNFIYKPDVIKIKIKFK